MGTKFKFARSRLARRLTAYVIVASTFVALFTSGLQIYSAYLNEIDKVYSGLEQIEKTHISNVSSRVWVLDTDELRTTLNGLLGLPSIQYLAVYDHNELLMEIGEDASESVITNEHDLTHTINKEQRVIGKLIVKATLEDTYQFVINQSIIIIGSNLIKTLIVAGLMLLIFYQLVARHLTNFSEFVGQQNLDTLDASFKYDRKENLPNDQDELDILNNSFFLMRKNLSATANELKLNIADRIEAHKELDEAHKELTESHDALQKSEQDLDITLNSIGDAVITTDSDGLVTRMNPVAEQLTGYSINEANGLSLKTVFPIINYSTREPIESPVDIVLTTGQTVYLSNDTTLISKDGTEYQIADSAAPIRNTSDHILGIVLVFNDVTDQYRLRQKAKATRLQMQRLLDGIHTMVSILELDGTLDFINKTPLKIMGIEPDSEVGKKLWESVWFEHDPTLQATVKNDVTNAAAGKSILRDIEVSTHNGLLWVEYSVHPVFNEQGVIVQLVAEGRDVSQRKTAEEKVLQQAHFDNLTKLPNRFLSLDRLSQQLIEAKRKNCKVAVLFLDLDDFKKINDTLGHETGDKLLVEAADRLNSIVRRGDTVGRLGGDEFIVLLGGLEEAVDARPVIESVIAQFRNAFRIDGRELILTSSVGVSIYPDDGSNASELLRNSDSAMYHAKEKGRNTYSYFTEEMNREVSRRLAIEEQLYGALERNEFQVFYQPKIELSSGRVIGAESLLRWNNAALGDISPSEFITITEQTGLIVPLGQFVLTEAIRMTKQWHQKFNKDFIIAVNFSPRQFLDPELVPFIEHTIQKSNIDAKCLELEITEGMLITGHSYIDEALTALNNLGVSIAMDDFGTGYSSLGYLRRYPFDVLKIDREFINDITIDQADMELVNATIVMAHALQIKVVAEGIETEDQLEYLKKLGCDFGQGYLFSYPVPAEEMTKWLQQN